MFGSPGGCGKTFIVQQYVARVVSYAFGSDNAIRMIAFSNPQVPLIGFAL